MNTRTNESDAHEDNLVNRPRPGRDAHIDVIQTRTVARKVEYDEERDGEGEHRGDLCHSVLYDRVGVCIPVPNVVCTDVPMVAVE